MINPIMFIGFYQLVGTAGVTSLAEVNMTFNGQDLLAAPIQWTGNGTVVTFIDAVNANTSNTGVGALQGSCSECFALFSSSP